MTLEKTNAEWAFDAYEAVRHRLPEATFGRTSQRAGTLADIADQFDVFLLDAFGVLNIGETAIEGVPERVADLKAAGKQVFVVTNAAGYPASVLMARYQRLGYSFGPDEVISSRAALLHHLESEPAVRWGIMASPQFGMDEFPVNSVILEDDPAVYAAMDGFLLFGASRWTEQRQSLLEAALVSKPRRVFVGNPDIVAPVETGLSREPGHYAHRLADSTGVAPRFFGKPFGNVYDIARERVGNGVSPDRVLMVGDTLHTDILGGRAQGFRAALVAEYGFFAGTDPAPAIARSGIVPDFILERP